MTWESFGSYRWDNHTQSSDPIPTTTVLDNVPTLKQHKVCQVIKDKDVALRNATITDTIVPEASRSSTSTVWRTRTCTLRKWLPETWYTGKRW